jgi:NADPH2:quinone reductase
MTFPRVIPHSDGAGVIDRVGVGVPESRLGERVWTWNAQWKRPFGTAAEFVVLPAEQAVPLPDGPSFDEGACLGIPALTAHRAVTIDGSVEGRTVLVSGGAGAVGNYAIQFAKLLGAGKVIATVSSFQKADRARAAGATDVINYRADDVAERVLEITAGRGADRVVEVDIAGNSELLPKIVAQDALCVAYGSNTPDVTFQFGPMIMRGVSVRFFIVYELSREAREQGVADLTRWMEAGQIKHEIAMRFRLDDIVQAHETLEQGKVIGKIIVTP